MKPETNIAKGRESCFNTEGWKFWARQKIVEMEKGKNPGRGEFPHGLDLKRRITRLLLNGPGNPRQDPPGPQSQNSPKLGWKKEKEFRRNCYFGDRQNKTT
jgi:hypothetical protein